MQREWAVTIQLRGLNIYIIVDGGSERSFGTIPNQLYFYFQAVDPLPSAYPSIIANNHEITSIGCPE